MNQLRRNGIVPANVYGKGISSYAVAVNADEFSKVYQKAGETVLVDLTLDKKSTPVLISNVQIHPLTEETIHVDFRQVDLKTKITASVPVVLVGESPAAKRGDGTLVQQIDEIEIESLPTDIPEHFELDVSTLEEVDSALYIKDLKFDAKKITLVDADLEQIITKVEAPQKEVEVPVVAEGTEETPAESGEPTPVTQEPSAETPSTEE